MPAQAQLPALAETAVTALFENAINSTRIFWSQRDDGSLLCADWEWCCPEIPAVLAGLEAVVFVTQQRSRVIKVGQGALVVALDARRVWGCWDVVPQIPEDATVSTWDDRLEIDV